MKKALTVVAILLMLFSVFSVLTPKIRAETSTSEITSFSLDDNLNVRVANVDATKFEAYFLYKSRTTMNPIAFALVDAGSNHNINSIFLMAVSAWESGWGTSNFVTNRHNWFGYGALYSNPDKAWEFSSDYECVDVVSRFLKADYLLDEEYGNYDVLMPTGEIYNPQTGQFHNGPPYVEELRSTGAHYHGATVRGWIIDWNLNNQDEMNGVLWIMNDFVSWHVQTYGVGIAVLIGSAEITFVNTASTLLISPNDYGCQPGEDVLIRLGAKNTGSVSLDLRVVLKIYDFRGYGDLGGNLLYDSTALGDDQEVLLEPGELSPVIEFHWSIPEKPDVPAYSVYTAIADWNDPELIYDSVGGPEYWSEGPLLHVPYDNGASGFGAAVIEWLGDSDSASEEAVGFFVDLGVSLGLTAIHKLAPSILSSTAAHLGGFAFGFLISHVGIANMPSMAEIELINIIDGSTEKEITIYGNSPVPLTIYFTPGTNIVWPLEVKVEKDMGFLQPRQLVMSFSISGDLWIAGTHAIYLKNALTFSEPGTYFVRIVGCSEDVAGFVPSEARVNVEPSVHAGVTSNIVPNGCVMMTFEDGTDDEIIRSTISGMQFTTTLGYDWIYGDKRTGKYNVYPYGSQAYVSKGNIFAWLGPNMGKGRIDFQLGSASYFSVLTSTYSGLVIDAYDSDDNLVATSGWASNNIFTYKFTRLTVEAPGIAYVLIHDVGNYWLIDDLVTNAPSLTFSPMAQSLTSDIKQGETHGWIVDVGPSPGDFTAELTWGGSNLDFYAFDPDGAIYSSILVSVNERVIIVHDPTPGYWRLLVYGEDVPVESETYTVSVSLGTDDVPPITVLSIESPQYFDGTNAYITSATRLNLVAEDNPGGTGVASTSYRVYNVGYDTGWQTYTAPFNLIGPDDGTYNIDYYSTDNAGNVESTNTQPVILDNTGPVITVSNPPIGWALQDGVTFLGSVVDAGSGVFSLSLSIREANNGEGIPIGFEDLPVFYDPITREWSLSFDTLLVPDGYYVLHVETEDNLGNEASTTVPYSIRNWAVIELLPSSEDNKAGRTMPVKFALVVVAEVDPAQPFVYNEELRIEIFATADPGDILQESYYGDTAADYRISSVLYITNFKTLKTPMEYTVAIYRDTFDVGSFTVETVK